MRNTCKEMQFILPKLKQPELSHVLSHWKETFLPARNASTHAGRIVTWGITWISTHPRHQHQPNDLYLWYWPCFVLILVVFRQNKGKLDNNITFAKKKKHKRLGHSLRKFLLYLFKICKIGPYFPKSQFHFSRPLAGRQLVYEVLFVLTCRVI